MYQVIFTLRSRKNRMVLLAAVMALGIWSAVLVQRAVNADSSAAKRRSTAPTIREAPTERPAAPIDSTRALG